MEKKFLLILLSVMVLISYEILAMSQKKGFAKAPIAGNISSNNTDIAEPNKKVNDVQATAQSQEDKIKKQRELLAKKDKGIVIRDMIEPEMKPYSQAVNQPAPLISQKQETKHAIHGSDKLEKDIATCLGVKIPAKATKMDNKVVFQEEFMLDFLFSSILKLDLTAGEISTQEKVWLAPYEHNGSWYLKLHDLYDTVIEVEKPSQVGKLPNQW